MIHTWPQLQTLIDSFDGTPADLDRIKQNPVGSVELLARLFEGIENDDEAHALIATNPRFAAELADIQDAYNSLVKPAVDFDAIAAAADPEPLIAALSPQDRKLFVSHMLAFPPDATADECAQAYLSMVVTDEI